MMAIGTSYADERKQLKRSSCIPVQQDAALMYKLQ